MISDSKKLTNGIVVYSALFSDFEALDFKNDALAGIRANYYNSNCAPQKDRLEINGGDSVFGLSYQFVAGKPISWKMNCNNRPYQSAKKMKDGAYCVSTFSALGAVIKRQFFSKNHEWLKTEFYDGTKKAELKATASPKIIEEIFAIEYETEDANGIKESRLLFPASSPKKSCTALVYSNLGMIWFDSEFKPEDLLIDQETVTPQPQKGFGLNTASFLYLSGKPAEIDLKIAPYFNEDKNSADKEENSYSAYDKIESIIYEAQKNNKNVLGEEKPFESDSKEAKSSDNNSNLEVNQPDLVKDIENNSDTEISQPDPEKEPENNSDTEISQPEPEKVPEDNSDAEISQPEPEKEPEDNSDTEISQPEPEKAPEDNSDTEISQPEPEKVPEDNSDTEISQPEPEKEPENNSNEEKSETDNCSNDAEIKDNSSEEPEILLSEEPTCDLALETSSGVYSYYGALDKNNLRSGRGRTTTPDGVTSYDGEYLAGKRHGFGVCYYKEGKINYAGNWNDGIRQGSGVGYRLSDGTMHAGCWKDNAPEGYGARFDKDGNLIDVSMYKNGVRNGKSVSFDENGNVLIGVWRNGELVSEKLIAEEGE